ncbi:MAG TPA: hypothetical protein VHD90_24195 [Phototrophicaceae bacterium]|nr:hypothetical protein [Phototrophicaceae bacterium]
MFLPPYMNEAENLDRLREGQRYAHNRTLREPSEPTPTEIPGLLQRIKQLVHLNTQDSRDVAHAA